jgi:purine-nucleoside phosphorylase
MVKRPGATDDDEHSEYARARAAADALAAAAPISPRVAIVLGSGLGKLADSVEDAITIPFTDIPHLAPTTVEGHAGRLVLGRLAGAPVAVLRGRLHFYEGYTPQQITFPMRVFGLLGVEVCILTNAAGGINPALTSGSLLLIRDHISLPTLAGQSPLFGANDDRFGARFPSMTDAYDPALRQLALEAARKRSIPLTEGVYVMVAGPSFETSAELRMLQQLGADAVGMSTTPEVIVARHMGMRVLAMSVITNETLTEAADQGETSHEDVLRAAADATDHVTAIVRDVIARSF